MSPQREKVRPPPNRRQVVRPPPLVLIVESDDDTREMYSESLTFSGVRVIASLDAGDAFQKAHITTDIGLPGGTDGCQLTSRLKNDTRTKNIPVIAVTAWASGGYAERARAAGCDSVLIKPVLPADLWTEIQRLLKRRAVHPTA
jgi:CheY-like chemotaxis protein